MGWPMAFNLRSKLGPEKTILISDVSEDAIARYLKETEGKGPVKIVKNGFDAVQQAVRGTFHHPFQRRPPPSTNTLHRTWS